MTHTRIGEFPTSSFACSSPQDKWLVHLCYLPSLHVTSTCETGMRRVERMLGTI